MDRLVRNYVVACIAVILIVMMYEFIAYSDFFRSFMMIVVMVVGYPCLVYGLYMFLEGKGSKGINGIDFSQYSEDERRNISSYVGLYLAIGSAILMLAISIIMANMILGIVLIIVSTAIFLVPFVKKGHGADRTFVNRGVPTKIAVFVITSFLVVVPSIYLCNSDNSLEVVTVEFLDDGFHLKAPMVDESFDYSSIEDLGYDEHFEKGSRQWGYGTPTISSGTFKNAQFGKYTLASYTKVDPCIFFLYKGSYYAFNQESDELTQQAFETLLTKI